VPTVISDDLLLGGPPLVSKWSIAAHLAREFPPDEEFYVYEGRPYAGRCDLDLMFDFGCDPPREAHPFMPCWRGQKVSEAKFRTLVNLLHGIGTPGDTEKIV
jgi:hypothetical protein